MSRAVALLIVALAACALASGSLAEEPLEFERPPEMVDGTPLLDFNNPPNFKVGSWVKYRTVSNSLLGAKDDYTLTLIVAGEQVLWGEPCVWIESWTERDSVERATATLISYAAFCDTMAFWRIEWFTRMESEGIDAGGKAILKAVQREPGQMKLRQSDWDASYKERTRVDTLGTEEVTIPLGTFRATKVLRHSGVAQSADDGDSTFYYRRSGKQTQYLSRKIPITSLIVSYIEDIQEAKSWRVGHFNNDSLRVLEHGSGTMMLVGYGDSGVTPKVVPPEYRHVIANRKLIDEFVNQKRETAVRTLK